MKNIVAAILTLVIPGVAGAQAALQQPTPSGPPPTLEEVRKAMGIPSADEVRGQQDAVGFASTAEQMAKVWALSQAPPAPERFGGLPPPGVAGLICPHDDYLYAGRVYRQLVPLVTAKTVVMVGVFHKYRRFGAHDALVFDSYRAWRAPDGEIPVSPLRDEILATLGGDGVVRDAASHDSEHSLEAIAYWLKHQRADVEIVPIIVPAMGFDRMQQLTARLAGALSGAIKRRGWQLGRDVAIVISSDAVHYGTDFNYTPYGDGGVEPYVKACAQDRALLAGPLAGPISTERVRTFFSTCVDPASPTTYRLTWCGRFSIPTGLLLLAATAADLGEPVPVGVPLMYATSVGAPELPVRALGMGETAPANLYHFVGYPAVAYVTR